MAKICVEDILKIIEKENLVKDAKALSVDVPLNQQGVDSLDFSGILFNIEEVFGVEIPDEALGQLKTIEDLVSYVSER
jgi:acyl carrier protein